MLDARLTYIRRQSGLDSRAALFVLSPVSQAELSEFIIRYARVSFRSKCEAYRLQQAFSKLCTNRR